MDNDHISLISFVLRNSQLDSDETKDEDFGQESAARSIRNGAFDEDIERKSEKDTEDDLKQVSGHSLQSKVNDKESMEQRGQSDDSSDSDERKMRFNQCFKMKFQCGFTECFNIMHSREQYKEELLKHYAESDLKLYSCWICGKDWDTIGYLISHVWSHDVQRPYMCLLINKKTGKACTDRCATYQKGKRHVESNLHDIILVDENRRTKSNK